MSDPIATVQRIALYDPLQLDEASFKHSFIARQKELTRMLQRIHEACNEANSHALHTLIYAHRGMGKTTLLRRISIAVNEDDALKKQWIPLNFREDQYNLASLDQLWESCADPLAGWCEANGDMENADHLDALVDSHSNCNYLDEITQICNLHNRRLLLLIDNLNLILDNLTEQEQWQLRGVLQKKNGPLLIACTASMPSQLSDEQSALFEFFRMQQLQPLKELELIDCLKRIARRRGQLGEKVLQEINDNPERVKALHRLCGGNPRTLMIIYLALEALIKVTHDQTFQHLLNEVLENVTPLYKARTEELAPQQRQIIDAIALHWDPINLASIAEITRLKKSSVSSQLKRLEKNGIVALSGTYQGKSLYQLAERFYNIWYLMRNGSRRHQRKLIWFSNFFTAYYSLQINTLNATRLPKNLVQGDDTMIADYLPTVDLAKPGMALIESAISLNQNNVGDALEKLKPVFQENSPLLWIMYRDDLLRLMALFYKRGFFSHVLTFLQENRFHLTLAPFVFALETINNGADYLQTINPEMRPEAESIYRYLASLLSDIKK